MILGGLGTRLLGAFQEREPEAPESAAGGPDELARLLVLLIKVQVNDQRRLILELIGAGFSAHRIASLTGAKYEAVRSTIRRLAKPGGGTESNTISPDE